MLANHKPVPIMEAPLISNTGMGTPIAIYDDTHSQTKRSQLTLGYLFLITVYSLIIFNEEN